MDISARISSITNKYKPYIVVATVIVILLLIGYFLSKRYRVKSRINSNEITLENRMTYQTDYCSPRLLPRKIVDYHVKSSHATVLSGFQKLDYASTEMLLNVIKNNVRYLEFSIFSRDSNNEAEPVVSVGTIRGNWKLTASTVSLRDVFNTIKDYAFNETVVGNYNDPVFIYLDIKTKYAGTLDQTADLIYQMFGDRILDKSYRYQRKNLCETSVCDLMDKVVIMSNTGFQNTRLEEYINISTSNGNLQRLEYSDIIIRRKFNVNAPDIFFKSNKISFHTGIGVNYIKINDYREDFRKLGLSRGYSIRLSGAKKGANVTGATLLEIDNITRDKISFKKSDKLKFEPEEFGNSDIVINGYKVSALDASVDIVDMNKNILTIVVPDEDFFSFNYNPRDVWFSGAQFVAMNYQTPDDNLKTYQHFFAKRAIKLKGSSLLRKLTTKEKTGIKSSSKLLNIAPKLETLYPINYEFIKNNIDSPIELSTFLNASLFFNFKNDTTPLKIGLKSTETKFTLTCELSNNKRIKNSINITVIHDGDRYFLGKFNEDSNRLSFKRQDNSISDFTYKTSFLALEPLCRQDKYTSLGFLNREVINGERLDILYYMKYRPNFSIKNKIYTTLTTTYKKIGKLSFKYGIGDEIKTAHFYRPIRQGEYRPLGDIIVDEGNYTASKLAELNGELPVYEIKTALVNGGVMSPTGYTEVYNNGSIISGNEQYFSIWKPIPPDGYIAMGNVIKLERGNTAPNRNLIWCVRADLVKPMEFIQESDNSLRKLENAWFNKEIGIWTKYSPSGVNSMRYFVTSYNLDKETGIKYDRKFSKATKLELKEPSELDNPVYSIKDFSDFTNDEIFLEKESKIKSGIDKDACCFGVTQSFKSGEFTEYNLYNNLTEIPDNDNKVMSYESNRNGKTRCLNIPYSYWSDYYKELYSVAGIPLEEKMKNSLFLKHKRDYSGETRYFQGEFPMDRNGCQVLTGDVVNSSNCKVDVARDDTIKNKYYINKVGSCPIDTKVADIKIVTDVDSCRDMGGSPNAKRGVAECNFEVCDNVFNKQTLILPKKNEDSKNTCEGYNVTDGYFLVKSKSDCEALGGVYNDKTGYCMKKLCFNPTPVKSQVNLGGCKDPDYFGTNFIHKSDDTIRLKNNSSYCLTAELDSGRVKSESPVTIQECNAERVGQQFIKNNNNNMKYVSSDVKIGDSENMCLTAGLDNSVKMIKCDPLQNNQRWGFEQMPEEFCLSSGSKVWYLDKSTFVRRGKEFPGNAINVPVENLLQEEYDYNNIHAYIAANIVSLNKEKREILYIPENMGMRKLYNNNPIKVSFRNAIDLFVLDYLPPRERLKLGAKVIVKNGKINYDKEPYINLTENQVRFFGVITEDLGDDHYKVFMSINSIEPNRKNRSFGRPDYSQVKKVHIRDILLLKKPPLC